MRITYANVTATIALIASLGTSTAAAGQMINGAHIKNGTIPAAKLTSAARASLRGQRGYTGSMGTTGATGLSGVVRVSSAPVSIPANTLGPMMTAQCPAGKRAISGGYYASLGKQSAVGVGTFDVTGWVYNDTGSTISNVQLDAICAYAT